MPYSLDLQDIVGSTGQGIPDTARNMVVGWFLSSYADILVIIRISFGDPMYKRLSFETHKLDWGINLGFQTVIVGKRLLKPLNS